MFPIGATFLVVWCFFPPAILDSGRVFLQPAVGISSSQGPGVGWLDFQDSRWWF